MMGGRLTVAMQIHAGSKSRGSSSAPDSRSQRDVVKKLMATTVHRRTRVAGAA